MLGLTGYVGIDGVWWDCRGILGLTGLAQRSSQLYVMLT